MRIDELIKRLEEVKAKQGNLNVSLCVDEDGSYDVWDEITDVDTEINHGEPDPLGYPYFAMIVANR